MSKVHTTPDVEEVRFIPVKHRQAIDTANLGDSLCRVVGFKPGPAKKREGWLVVIVVPKAKAIRKKV